MIGGVVYTALRGLVNDRVYPNRFPQTMVAPPGSEVPSVDVAPKWPAIRYTVTNANNEADVCGTDDTSTDDTDVQIDVVALTYGAMVSLRDQVISAMQGLDPPCTREAMFELPDADTMTHRCILTYRFFASTPGGVSP